MSLIPARLATVGCTMGRQAPMMFKLSPVQSALAARYMHMSVVRKDIDSAAK
jgi:hypothetical protein